MGLVENRVTRIAQTWYQSMESFSETLLEKTLPPPFGPPPVDEVKGAMAETENGMTLPVHPFRDPRCI